MPPECTDYLYRLFGTAYKNLDKNAQIILGTAYLEGGVTNVRMQSILELHSIEIGYILSSLVDKDMLIADRKGRWTSYKINIDYEAEQLQFAAPSSDMTALKNETDKIIYEYIKANGFITTHQILDITRITTMAGASVALGRLMDAKLIEKVRQGRQFIYQLKK